MHIIMCYIYTLTRAGSSCVISKRSSSCSGSVGWREAPWNLGRGVVLPLGTDTVFKVTAAFVGLVTFHSLSRKSSQCIFLQLKETNGFNKIYKLIKSNFLQIKMISIMNVILQFHLSCLHSHWSSHTLSFVWRSSHCYTGNCWQGSPVGEQWGADSWWSWYCQLTGHLWMSDLFVLGWRD